MEVKNKMEEHKIVETESVSIREVKPNEERNFTPWLEENLHLLKMGLEPYERESIVYDKLRIDLLVKSEIGELVAIENQYNTSDNNHLAKILVYLTGSEANIGIWIAEEFKEQHKEVILNLNKKGAYNIYLIKVSAKKIIEDLEIPRYTIDFTVVIGPDTELREIARTKRPLTEREIFYQRFWWHLLEKIKTKPTKLFSGRSRSIGNYLSTPSEISAVRYMFLLLTDEIRIELNINTDNKDKNKEIFDNIIENKDEIETIFKDKLNWERKELIQYSKINYAITDRDWTDESKWDELHEEMIDTMIRFEGAIRTFLKE